MLSTVEPHATATPAREDIVFADFEREDWGEWSAEGAAFEGGPFPVKSRSVEQKITGHSGESIANSYNTRLGGDHIAADTRTGTLVSPEFTVERNSIRMTVGGGNRKGVYVAVIVDGKEVARVAGKNSSTLYPVSIDMTAYQGKRARIHIVDEVKGGWAHITVDQIVFSDGTGTGGGLADKHGYGPVVSDAAIRQRSAHRCLVPVAERDCLAVLLRPSKHVVRRAPTVAAEVFGTRPVVVHVHDQCVIQLSGLL
jgi:hypothetical protein